LSRAYDDTTYHPGVVGLNNIKANDYENVVLHVSPFRTLVQDRFTTNFCTTSVSQ
ncbi:hypothetical protein AB6A40_005385, partial [Gnathostoma spinigerum]